MHILCSTDSNYIMPTAVMMKSVSVNNFDVYVCFHIIIDKSVDLFQKKQLQDVVDKKKHTVIFHTFDETLIDTFPRIGEVKENYITKATYYRLFVTKILPDDLEKIIYLDGDVVVDKPLKYLWEIDMSNYAIAGVTDMSEMIHDYHRLGYDTKFGYFNAGVLVINLKYWREHNVIENFMDIIINQPERIKLHDQDILNIVFYNRKLVLPLRYNVQSGFLYKPEYQQMDYERYKDELHSAIYSGMIIHFCNEIKPWHKDCKNPLKRKWIKYLKMTKWKNYRFRRKFPLPLRTKIGNFLRKYHVLRPKYATIYNPYIDIDFFI